MTSNWKPDPKDTAALAAIQWHVNNLHNRALTAYITDRTKYLQILKAFRVALQTIRSTQNLVQCRIDSDCPEGYKCVDGVCEPENESNEV